MAYRLQKYLAHSGIASRRASEELIFSGKIIVNGKTVLDPSIKIEEGKDEIKYNGKLVKLKDDLIYIMLNKPVKFVSTMKDEKNRCCLKDLVRIDCRIYPIGRLDYMTEGLLILTNDGDVYNKIIHPRQGIDKNYIVKLTSSLSNDEHIKLENGILYKGIKYGKSKIENIGENTFKITIWEGKNRQIRNMLDSVDKDIIYLKRISIGNINIGDLKLGRWRYLSHDEISYLKGL
ncbi:MAG: rRNA pseudouridine synthase [Oscillospiraceae bacterium]|nr:rRNA pseudouridine synthase [Oscillospiraceae bacterium]